MAKKRKKEKGRNFDKKAMIGLILLLASYFLGALLRNAAQITSSPHPRGFEGICDTYISWLCIPTYYFSIQLGTLIWLVVNVTSFLSSAILFILGVILIRQ